MAARKRGLDIPPVSRVNHIKLRNMPLGGLILDPENVKIHTEEQILQIMGSIQQFGFGDPVGITPAGKVLEGHGRIEAARRLGMREVPTIIVSGLSPEQEQAYAIAHNQTNLNSGLNMELVADEFSRFSVSPHEFGSLGFEPADFLRVEAAKNKQDHNGHDIENLSKHLPKVLKTKMAFENERQMRVWEGLVTRCREVYAGETIAARLIEFAKANDPIANNG